MVSPALGSQRVSAPAPTLLDVFVLWHPDDTEGEGVCDALFRHYHSEAFAGLAGSAIEVYGRSHAVAPERDSRPAPIHTADGVIGDPSRLPTRPAPFSAILPIIGRHLVQASDRDQAWAEYLSDILRVRDASSDTKRTLVLPVVPTGRIGYENAPLIGHLMSRQSLQACDDWLAGKSAPSWEERDLPREVGQALVQKLFRESEDPEKLTVFISYCRGDNISGEKTKPDVGSPAYLVGKVAKEARLETFLDVCDIQLSENWQEQLDQVAKHSALLMVRTDAYAGREATQWEVLEAKKAGMPVVCLSSLSHGERRGSFLMDHVPTVLLPRLSAEAPVDGATNPTEISGVSTIHESAIMAALNRLVDESLKRALWRHQEIPRDVDRRFREARRSNISLSADHDGFDAAPAFPPEPLMLTRFLAEHRAAFPDDEHLWLLHPDPPLLPPEHEVMVELCHLSGYTRGDVHLLTPRTFFAAGGTYGDGEPALSTPNLADKRPLSGTTLGISMALAEDLDVVGMRNGHLELAVAEISQLVLLSGGAVTYAGGVGTHVPDLTSAVIDTVQRYIEAAKLQQHRHQPEQRHIPNKLHPGEMFRLTVPCSSITKPQDLDLLQMISERFASSGSVEVLGEHGELVKLNDAVIWAMDDPARTTKALSAVRSELPKYCDARLILGGKTTPFMPEYPKGFRGKYPGIMEEALHTVRAGQPLYVAGGFGGAAALLAILLDPELVLPVSPQAISAMNTNTDYHDLVDEIKEFYNPSLTGLDEEERRKLMTTRRASELAGLVVKGLVQFRGNVT